VGRQLVHSHAGEAGLLKIAFSDLILRHLVSMPWGGKARQPTSVLVGYSICQCVIAKVGKGSSRERERSRIASGQKCSFQPLLKRLDPGLNRSFLQSGKIR